MGVGFSNLGRCLKKRNHHNHHHRESDQPRDITLADSSQLDETLGHSFCYVRSSARFPSPTPSDRFLSPTRSLRFDDPDLRPPRSGPPEIGFKAISGASVSANSSTPRTGVYDDGIDALGAGGSRGCITNGFESTSSFSAIPLQPFPRGCDPCGPSERGFFMSGPLERGGHSGPLDGMGSGVGEGRIPFSAPLGGSYKKKKRKKGFAGMRRSFYRKFSEKKRHWVVPVRYFAGKKEAARSEEDVQGETEARSEGNVQWALGRAGEDRVHVVVSEEHGWLFVGIYDGFNGPDAPDFLMSNLYSAVFQELEGLFWDAEADDRSLNPSSAGVEAEDRVGEITGEVTEGGTDSVQAPLDRFAKRVTFEQEHKERKRHLWEYLSEADPDEGIDLSGPERFAFSVDDALGLGGGRSSSSMRWLLLSKLKEGFYKHKSVGKTEPWRFGISEGKIEDGNRRERSRFCCSRKRKVGPADHVSVLSALSRALNDTEIAYLDMTDKFIDTNPELALMGSCLLAVLMRDDDVYVMNLGDSRAIVAQNEQHGVFDTVGKEEVGPNMEGTTDDFTPAGSMVMNVNAINNGLPAENLKALQLSTDHSTSIDDEVIRIKKEHPDDDHCIVNDRVKGRLKVTRAFGAGYLKKDKWNYALLEMFRNEFVGTAPYVSCSPSLHHHKLCSKDQFLILSSDGLYQYLSNQEVVFLVASFMEKFPEGDPAQHLIEELLFRAAKKAGMDLHELLDIPHGDRRKYHDDVTVMVISLEGRIWKSSGKCL